MDRRSINEEYAEIGSRLIESEEALEDIKCSAARIIYLSSEHKKMADGEVVFAQCEKVAIKNKWAIPADYTITVFEPNVEGLTDKQMEILLFHELLHISIGQDSVGNDIYGIKPHDLKDFKLIIDRYGTEWNKKEGE